MRWVRLENESKIIIALCLFALISLLGLAILLWWVTDDSRVVVYKVTNGSYITTVEKVIPNRKMVWVGVCWYIVWECAWAFIIGLITLFSLDWDRMDWGDGCG